MGRGILMVIMAIVAQAAAPAQETRIAPKAKDEVKAPADQVMSSKRQEAQRLLRNGRYAEAEEALSAVELDAGKAPGGLTPALKAELALDRAECQASQGEYGKAIERPQVDRCGRRPERRPAGAAGRALSGSRRLGSRRGGDATGGEARPRPLAGPVGRGAAAGAAGRARQGGRGLEVVRRSVQRKEAGDRRDRPSGCSWSARPPSDIIARAPAGEELSDALNDVINDIYEAALRVDPNCWQAPWLEGRLFLSGYNERAATRELTRASRSTRSRPRCW